MVAGSAATAVDTRGTGSVRVETPVHASGAAADHGVPHFVRDDRGEGVGPGGGAAAETASAAVVRGDSQAGAAGHPIKDHGGILRQEEGVRWSQGQTCRD